MKSILFMCESYYRLPSPNGICVQAVAEEAVKEGCRVDIVTIYNAENQPEAERINGVNVYRVDPGFIRRMIYKTNSFGNSKQNKLHTLIAKISAFNGLLHAFRYPLLSKRQVRNLYIKAWELYKRNKYQYVVTVYQQIHPVLAGMKLKKDFPVINLVLYTLDAISGGWVPNILHSHKIPMSSLKRWEKYFFSRVDRIFAMESHRLYYQKKEYDKFKNKIIYMDIPLLKPLPEKKVINRNGKLIRCVFTGSMHKDTANPEYLLKLLLFLKNIEVHIYGHVAPDIEEMLQNSPVYGKQVFCYGKVEHDKVLDIQRNADVLLNFGNSNPNMIPCKIFEYISTGNPVVSFTHSNEDSSLPYMHQYPNAIIIKEDNALIEDNCVKIRKFLNDIKTVKPSSIKEKFLKNTPEYFLHELN